jgi:hypothetical protein
MGDGLRACTAADLLLLCLHTQRPPSISLQAHRHGYHRNHLRSLDDIPKFLDRDALASVRRMS